MPCSSATSGGTAAVPKSSLNRQILGLAIPAIVANITTPLLSLVDVAIVGRLGSAAFVAAIAVGGTMFNLLYWLFGFLRTGTSGLTAQAVGRHDSAESSLILGRSLVLAATFALLLLLLHRPVGLLLLQSIDPDAATRAEAWLYFRIVIWGAPASLASFALTGWFIGRQDTRATMWVSLLINVVNIATSLILVWGLHMKMAGVAVGTLTAQWFGLGAALWYAVKRHGFRPAPLRDILHGGGFRRFFSVNADIFLRTLCLIAVTLWFTRSGAAQGAMMLAVNTLLMQFFTLFSYCMDGFAFAGEALCGKACGSGDHAALRATVRRLLRFGAIVATAFTVIYFVGGEWFLGLLTTDRDIIAAAADYRLWAVAIPAAGFMAFTWDGIFIGITRTRLMLISIAIASAIFFALLWALTPALGNHGLWIAFLSYLLARGLSQSLLFAGTQPRSGRPS